jgi:hypothetical protein
MLENKFVFLFVTFVWMGGLFAIVLVLAHMLQDRRYHRLEEGYTWGMPRILVPLYAALATFCLGLALHAYSSQRQISLWLTIVWAALAISFAARMIRILFIGLRQGWESRLNARLVPLSVAGYGERGMRIPIWLSVTALLLLVNLYLLGSWESTHINAIGLAEHLSGLVPAKGTSTPRPTAAPADDRETALRAVATKTPAVALVDITATATVTTPVILERQPVSSTPISSTPISSAPISSILNGKEEVTATSSPTATLIAEHTPSPTVQPIEATVTVKNARGANVRKAPNLSAAIMTVLEPAVVAPVLGRTADNKWFYIALRGGETGWISVQVVQPSATVNLSPIVAVP